MSKIGTVRLGGRLGVRRKECPVFSRVAVGAYGQIARRAHVSNRSAYIQQYAIGMRFRHRQALAFAKLITFLIILLRGSKLRRELFRRQIMMIIQAGRVINLLKQIGKRLPVFAAAGQWPGSNSSCWKAARWTLDATTPPAHDLESLVPRWSALMPLRRIGRLRNGGNSYKKTEELTTRFRLPRQPWEYLGLHAMVLTWIPQLSTNPERYNRRKAKE